MSTHPASFSAAAKAGAHKRFPDGSVDFFESSDFTIDCASVTLGGVIARGSFGVVYNGKLNGNSCAVKIEDFDFGIEEQINLIVELTILQSFPHDRMVRFLGAGFQSSSLTGPKIMILMELCQNGTLRDILKLNLPWNLLVRLALDIARGVDFLHGQNIIHRDLKTMNVLIDDNYCAKLCDFSFACHEESTSKRDFVYGTEEFMSPEVALALDFDKSADIFSFGIILCEVMTLKEPSQKFLSRKAQNLFALDEVELSDSVVKGCPEELEALACQCCDIEPSRRPTVQTCIEELESILLYLGDTDFTPFTPSVSVHQAVTNGSPLPFTSHALSRDLPHHLNGGRESGHHNEAMDARFALFDKQIQELRAENIRLSSDLSRFAVILAGREKADNSYPALSDNTYPVPSSSYPVLSTKSDSSYPVPSTPPRAPSSSSKSIPRSAPSKLGSKKHTGIHTGSDVGDEGDEGTMRTRSVIPAIPLYRGGRSRSLTLNSTDKSTDKSTCKSTDKSVDLNSLLVSPFSAFNCDDDMVSNSPKTSHAMLLLQLNDIQSQLDAFKKQLTLAGSPIKISPKKNTTFVSNPFISEKFTRRNSHSPASNSKAQLGFISTPSRSSLICISTPTQVPIQIPDEGPRSTKLSGTKSSGQLLKELSTYDNGTYDNGTYDNGTYDNGTYDNGTYDNGTYDNGVERGDDDDTIWILNPGISNNILNNISSNYAISSVGGDAVCPAYQTDRGERGERGRRIPRGEDDIQQNGLLSAANRCRDIALRDPVNNDLSSALDKYLTVVKKLTASTTKNLERTARGDVSEEFERLALSRIEHKAQRDRHSWRGLSDIKPTEGPPAE